MLRNECCVTVDIEDKDEPSIVLGSLDLWLCLDDHGPAIHRRLDDGTALKHLKTSEPFFSLDVLLICDLL